MKNFLRSWFTRQSNPSRNSRPVVRPRRTTLSLEPLEDRLVLSTYTVNTLADANPPQGVLTLRQAITAADSDNNIDINNPDIINLGVTGTLALQSALPALTGSVTLNGPGTAGLTLRGDGQSDAILSVAPGAFVSLSGLTLDGNQYQNSGIAVGSGASLSIQDAAVLNAYINGNGGGIASSGGTVVATRARFVNDVANQSGGAIANLGGTLQVVQCAFDHEIAFGDGGAIFDAAVTGPSGPTGGSLNVQDSTFSNNFGSYRGGAIELSTATFATVTDSTFTGNFGPFVGGAISLFRDGPSGVTGRTTLLLSGSTLAGNSATNSGGGLYVPDSNAVYPVTCVLTDTIVAGNLVGTTPSDIYGALDSSGAYNLIGSGAGLAGLSNGFNSNLVGTAALPLDPRLGPLQDNGGPTFTMALLPGSPAIDRGAPDPIADETGLVDQRGNPRIVAQSFVAPPAGGDHRDIGAFELGAQVAPTILTVNSTADADPPAGEVTLREALQAATGAIPVSSLPPGLVTAGTPYGFEIQFSITGTIALGTALPAITTNAIVAVAGPGASNLTLLGDGRGDAILTLAPDAFASLSGLTLDGNQYQNSGIAVGSGASLGIQDAAVLNAGTSGYGGGIDSTGGTVVASRVRFANDVANQSGAGIANRGGTLQVIQCTFDSNIAFADGGGVFDAAAATSAGPTGGVLVVQDSTFVDGYSALRGGGIELSTGTYATVTDSTFTGNLGPFVGGAISLFRDGPSGVQGPTTLLLSGSTLAGNSASTYGGGLYVQPAYTMTCVLTNTIVAGNLVGTTASDVYGTLDPSSSYNLFGTGGSGGLTSGNGNQVGVANPGLGVLGSYGGPTQTIPLLPGSPAIDAGSNIGVPATDQAGQPRIANLVADIGAFEYQWPATQLSVVPSTTSTVAGKAFTLAVTALNQFGTFVPGFQDTLHLASSNPSDVLPSDYTFTAADVGQHTFTITLKKAGSHMLTLSDQSNPDLGPIATTVTIHAAAMNHFIVAAPASVTAGVGFNVTVTASDPYGNVIPGYLGTITFSSTDAQAVLPAKYKFTLADHGTHTFSNVVLKTAGTRKLTVQDTHTPSRMGVVSESVKPNVAVAFVVAGVPATATAGVSYAFTVTAVDAYGNRATGYVGTLALSSSDPHAVFPVSHYTFHASDKGTHTFHVTLKTLGVQSITAQDSVNALLSGSEEGIQVVA